MAGTHQRALILNSEGDESISSESSCAEFNSNEFSESSETKRIASDSSDTESTSTSGSSYKELLPGEDWESHDFATVLEDFRDFCYPYRREHCITYRGQCQWTGTPRTPPTPLLERHINRCAEGKKLIRRMHRSFLENGKIQLLPNSNEECATLELADRTIFVTILHHDHILPRECFDYSPNEKWEICHLNMYEAAVEFFHILMAHIDGYNSLAGSHDELDNIYKDNILVKIHLMTNGLLKHMKMYRDSFGHLERLSREFEYFEVLVGSDFQFGDLSDNEYYDNTLKAKEAVERMGRVGLFDGWND